jgi:hypothetical protein
MVEKNSVVGSRATLAHSNLAGDSACAICTPGKYSLDLKGLWVVHVWESYAIQRSSCGLSPSPSHRRLSHGSLIFTFPLPLLLPLPLLIADNPSDLPFLSPPLFSPSCFFSLSLQEVQVTNTLHPSLLFSLYHYPSLSLQSPLFRISPISPQSVS